VTESQNNIIYQGLALYSLNIHQNVPRHGIDWICWNRARWNNIGVVVRPDSIRTLTWWVFSQILQDVNDVSIVFSPSSECVGYISKASNADRSIECKLPASIIYTCLLEAYEIRKKNNLILSLFATSATLEIQW